MAATAIGQALFVGVPALFILFTASSNNPGMDDLFSVVETKLCTTCGEIKPLTEYHRHSQNRGVRPRCKACRAIEQKALGRAHHAGRYMKNREVRLAYNREYRKTHAAEIAAQQKQWRADNRDKLKNKRLLRDYGIDLEEWGEMFERQGRACKICKSTTPQNKMGWHTDHGVTVRGILCHHCNTGMGAFNHDVGLLKAAIRYLAK